MRKKLGLALGSGGARGGIHLGVIKVLLENNITVDFVSGSSAGSIVGSYFALFGNIDGMLKDVMEFKKRKIIDIIDLNNPTSSLIRGGKAKKFLTKNWFGDKEFKDTKIPLKVAATCLEDGKLVVLDSGKIVDAAITSSTIPGIFPVVKYGDKHLVDGGLADAVPIDIVEKMGADVVLAVDLSGVKLGKMSGFSTMRVLERTYKIMMKKLDDYSEIRYDKNVLLVKPDLGTGFNSLSFHKTKDYVKIGEEAMQEAMPRLKRMLGIKSQRSSGSSTR